MRIAAALALLAAPLHAAPAAAATCGACHRAEAEGQSQTAMAQALAPASRCDTLQSHRKLVFRQGETSYLIERAGDDSWYDVTLGADHVRVRIQWAFGLGFAGQTYVVEYNGALYETRVSYYRTIDGLDVTVGYPREAPHSLEEAIGHVQYEQPAKDCFNCHSSGAVVNGVLRTDLLKAGVSCERCHAGAQAHMDSFRGGANPAQSVPPKLSLLTTEELSDFCGQCHRTWAQIAANGPHDLNNLRFQPYRLTNSRCYDSADTRIRCVACHDPHKPLEREARAYDARCTACHSAGGKTGAQVCKVAQHDCTNCHMPKIDLPGAHHQFTDHWIRVARKGEPVPN